MNTTTGSGEYEVGEIDGPVGWCKLTIFEAGLSDAGVYKIVFPFEPARYNQEITVKVNHFKTNLPRDLELIHYDVAITPDVSKKINRQIVKTMIDQYVKGK